MAFEKINLYCLQYPIRAQIYSIILIILLQNAMAYCHSGEFFFLISKDMSDKSSESINDGTIPYPYPVRKIASTLSFQPLELTDKPKIPQHPLIITAPILKKLNMPVTEKVDIPVPVLEAPVQEIKRLLGAESPNEFIIKGTEYFLEIHKRYKTYNGAQNIKTMYEIVQQLDKSLWMPETATEANNAQSNVQILLRSLKSWGNSTKDPEIKEFARNLGTCIISDASGKFDPDYMIKTHITESSIVANRYGKMYDSITFSLN